MPSYPQYQPARRERECRPQERRWRDHCVDKNLEDSWLERLNDLRRFDLISICEGHFDSRRGAGDRSPHINLRLRSSALPASLDELALRLSALRTTVDGSLSRDAWIRFDLTVNIRAATSVPPSEAKVVLCLRARHRREGEILDSITYDWFTNAVAQIEAVDAAATVTFPSPHSE